MNEAQPDGPVTLSSITGAAEHSHPLMESDSRLNQTGRERAEVLKLCGDETRFLILLHLSDGELDVTTLCEKLGMSQPAVSHHLALLRNSNILTMRRDGKHNFYSRSQNAVARNIFEAMTATGSANALDEAITQVDPQPQQSGGFTGIGNA